MAFMDLGTTPVGDVRRRDPVVVSRQTKLRDVVRHMAERNRGAVLVVEDGVLVGIFTEANLVRGVDFGGDWENQPVAGYMTEKVKTATPRTSITAALLLMTAGDFRHLPIIDDRSAPQSILSIRDIIAHIAYCYPKELINLPPSPELETKNPWGG